MTFVGIGGYFLLLGVALLYQTIHFRWVAIPARATVIGYEVEVRDSGGEDDGTYHHPQVTFLDSASETRTGTIRVSGLGSHLGFPIGKEIEILYDPADTGEVQVPSRVRFWFDLCVGVFMTVMCGTGVVVGFEILLGRKEVSL